MPPIELPRWLDVPPTGATTGVPCAAIMSTPWWRRPPERGVAPRVDEGDGALHRADPVAAGDRRRSGPTVFDRAAAGAAAGCGCGRAAAAAAASRAASLLGLAPLALELLEAGELGVEGPAPVAQRLDDVALLAERGVERRRGPRSASSATTRYWSTASALSWVTSAASAWACTDRLRSSPEMNWAAGSPAAPM